MSLLDNLVMKIAGKDPEGKVKGVSVNQEGFLNIETRKTITSTNEARRHGELEANTTETLMETDKEVELLYLIFSTDTMDSLVGFDLRSDGNTFRFYGGKGGRSARIPRINATVLNHEGAENPFFSVIKDDSDNQIVILRPEISPLKLKGLRLRAINDTGESVNVVLQTFYNEVG